jgi:hypothetical protein
VYETLVKQATDERSVEWLSEKAFTPGGWRTAREGGRSRRDNVVSIASYPKQIKLRDTGEDAPPPLPPWARNVEGKS